MAETKTLISLIKEANELAMRITENGGLISPEIEQELDLSNQALSDKADRYGAVLQALMAQEMICDAAVAEWEAVKNSTEAAIENLKGRMMTGMKALDIAELSGQQSVFKIQANQPSVIIDDQSKLPGEFLVTKVPPPVTQPDKKSIKDAITSGREVPGAHIERNLKLTHKIGVKRIK